jgi:DNA-binding NarL/FixJ family response regulator
MEPTMERIALRILAQDPILYSGVAAQLRPRPEVLVLGVDDSDEAAVALVVADGVGDDNLQSVRAGRRCGLKVVLVVSDVDANAFMLAVEAGIAGLVRRWEATPDRLVSVIRSAAAGEGVVPPDLVGPLLERVGRTRQQNVATDCPTFSGLIGREVDVLRLVAEGLDTAEIAAKLSYSERTVKSVIHDITSRLHLRNRAHAVAYAMQQGLI